MDRLPRSLQYGPRPAPSSAVPIRSHTGENSLKVAHSSVSKDSGSFLYPIASSREHEAIVAATALSRLFVPKIQENVGLVCRLCTTIMFPMEAPQSPLCLLIWYHTIFARLFGDMR